MINLSNELKLLEEFEGFMPHPYLCPANKLTIGFGEIILPNKTYGKFSGDFIIKSSKGLNNRQLKARWDNLITVEEAREILLETVYRDFYLEIIDDLPILNRNELSAILSFVYNIGVNGFKKSTFLKLLKAGNRSGASKALLNWSRVGDNKTMLLRRRMKEQEVFLNVPN